MRVQERVQVIRDELQKDFDQRKGEMSGQLSARVGWIAQISKKMGVLPPSTASVHTRRQSSRRLTRLFCLQILIRSSFLVLLLYPHLL
jgi:hypothetical protein